MEVDDGTIVSQTGHDSASTGASAAARNGENRRQEAAGKEDPRGTQSSGEEDSMQVDESSKCGERSDGQGEERGIAASVFGEFDVEEEYFQAKPVRITDDGKFDAQHGSLSLSLSLCLGKSS